MANQNNAKLSMSILLKKLRLKALKYFIAIKNVTQKLINKLAKITNLTRKEMSVIIIATIIAIVLLFIFFPKPKETAQTTASVNDKSSSKAGVLTKGTPTYKTLLPSGKTIKELGGWTRVSPSNVAPAYAYVDKIGNVPINVSQQQLPEEFKDDNSDQIETLASDFKATEKITVGNTTVYIGTSAKGPQSIIFNKDNLLILIKSSVQISSDKWAEYINSLQ